MVYMFINQLKAEGVKPYIYEEFQSKKAIDFENITKSPAMRYGNALGRRMNYLSDEKDIDNILWGPYAFENYNQSDIEARMAKLVPENMLAIFQSLTVKKDKEQSPEKFTTERWYQKDFMIEEMTEDFKAKLRTCLPEEGMKLGHAPQNKFMPKAENLKNMKLSRQFTNP